MISRLGLLLSVFVACYWLFIMNVKQELAYAYTANFFFYYCCVVCSVVFTLITVISLLLPLLGVGKSLEKDSSDSSAVAGFIAGGFVGVLLFFISSLHTALIIGGSWLLSTAAGDTWNDFNVPRLVIGSIMILISMFWRSPDVSKFTDDK